MPTHEEIIRQVKFLGIELYKRTRIEEHEIQVNAQQNIARYPGLLVASASIPFSSPSPSWVMMAHRSIELTLLSLIINDFIELVIFTDTKSYLDDLFAHQYKNYRLAVKNQYSGDDILSQSIFNSVKHVEEKRNKKADVKTVVRYLLDVYLDENGTHKRPQKAFVAILLKRYDRKHQWLTIKIRKNVLFPSKIELNITDQKQKELYEAYQTLYDILGIIKQQSHVFSLYTNEFYKIIHSEFARREPSSD